MKNKLAIRICAIVMVLITVFSCFALAASAQTTFWISSNSYSYNGNSYCTCTLKKPGKKDAKVKVSLTSQNATLSIKMTDNQGRVIWSENNSIKPTINNTRTYTLGRDHSVYRLYFKATNGKGYGQVRVSKPVNCTIA